MKNIKILAILALFCGLTFLFFYPVFMHFGTRIAGFYSSDEPYGVIWSFWWLKYAFLHKLPANFLGTIAYPFGISINAISFFPLWSLFVKYIAIFSNEIIAYNSMLMITFVLSGLTMYLLVFYLTRNKAAGIFSGLIYAFCPFHIVRLWQHFGTAQIQWMPLYILLLFKLRDHKNIGFALYLGFVLALNYYYDVHYAYFMLIITALFILLSLAKEKKRYKYIGLFCLAGLFGMLLIIPAFLPFLGKIVASTKGAPDVRSFVRPFEDLFAQSARPLSYILPFTEQPLMGNFTKMFAGTNIWGYSLTENNIFLGYIPLFLALIALKKRRVIVSLLQQKNPDISLYLKFFFGLVLVSWLFSQPPWWNVFGIKIYMPSFFMYKILPMFRAYVRFAIVVMLGVSVLAGFALTLIVSKLKPAGTKVLFVILVSCLALFEFWSNPVKYTINLADYPKAYDWLKGRPGDFAVAEYPLDAAAPNELYKFYQTKHGKNIINGTLPGTHANTVSKSLVKLSAPNTITSLSWMQVKYVLVHRDAFVASGLVEDKEEFTRLRNIPGLKFIRAIDNVDIYEVTTLPVKPVL